MPQPGLHIIKAVTSSSSVIVRRVLLYCSHNSTLPPLGFLIARHSISNSAPAYDLECPKRPTSLGPKRWARPFNPFSCKTFPIVSFLNFLKMAFYLHPQSNPTPQTFQCNCNGKNPMMKHRTEDTLCMCEHRNRLSGSLIGW